MLQASDIPVMERLGNLLIFFYGQHNLENGRVSQLLRKSRKETITVQNQVLEGNSHKLPISSIITWRPAILRRQLPFSPQNGSH